MINTVLGEIGPELLGRTLCHEHVILYGDGVDYKTGYDREEIMGIVLPKLLDAKEMGCRTIVDAGTYGAGRDVRLLAEASRKSGLNIVTNVGVWDGAATDGSLSKSVPDSLKDMTIEQLTASWSSEFFNGIDGTEIKPGIIKVAIGMDETLTDFHKKVLIAAVRTSLITNMPVECHCHHPEAAMKAVKIAEEESLPLNKLILLHVDYKMDHETIKLFARKGIYVEFDYGISIADDFSWHIKILKDLIAEGLTDRILFSLDAILLWLGEGGSLRPISVLFHNFIPFCLENGIPQETIDRIMIHNPSLALNIE